MRRYHTGSRVCSHGIRSALLALASLLASAGPARPDDCGAAEPRGVAFARVSPLELYAQKRVSSEDPEQREVPFARPLDVIEFGDTAVQLCISGRGKWAKRAHLHVSYNPQWVVLPRRVYSYARPKLRFWRSQERLASYLSGLETSKAPPDYEEMLVDEIQADIRLPVFFRDVVQTEVGNRQIPVASVLVPFHRDAVTRFLEIRETLRSFAEGRGAVALVLDVSGSTAGFVDPFLDSFTAALDAPTERELTVVTFGGDGSIGEPETMPLPRLAERHWPVRSAPRFERGTHLATEAIASAAGELRGKKATLLVLAGGDVAFEARAADGFEEKLVMQLTPELDDSLEESAARLDPAADFIAFDTDSPATLAERLAGPARDAPPAGASEPDAEDFAEVAEIAAEAGLLPLLPRDLPGASELAVPPAFAKRAEWFAVPLWTVVDGTLLKFERE